MDVTLSCSPDGERDDGVCVDSCISASGSTEDFFRLIRRLFLPLGLFYLIKENFARGLLRLSLFGLIFI